MYSKEELIKFLTDIFNGKNPYNGNDIPESHFLCKPDALRKIHAIILELNNGKEIVKKEKVDLKKEEVSEEKLEQIVTPQSVYITPFLKKVNEYRKSKRKSRISTKEMFELLISEGYVYHNENAIKVPTLKGEECGIISVYRELRGHKFYAMEYNMHAQKELVKLVEKHFK